LNEWQANIQVTTWGVVVQQAKVVQLKVMEGIWWYKMMVRLPRHIHSLSIKE
jgi:hypothetical protein